MKEKLEIIKTKAKEIFNHIFIDGLTGMAWGLFSTLIIGLIIEQIGKLVGNNQIGNMLIIIGKICASLTGGGIGVGVALKYKAIPSAALSIILNLNGLAAGAATVGCCANMIGFAVASYKENKVGGLLSQGIGTSMLQVPNIMKKPVIWLPAIIAGLTSYFMRKKGIIKDGDMKLEL